MKGLSGKIKKEKQTYKKIGQFIFNQSKMKSLDNVNFHSP